MRLQIVFVSGMLVLSGCLSIGGTPPVPGPGPARPQSPPQPAVASKIIASMDGGLVGSVSSKLGDNDRRMALEAEYRALEYTAAGKPVAWQGSGGSGEVVAAQPYRVGSQDCRQYSHALTIGGQQQTARGTACRNADGSWTPLT